MNKLVLAIILSGIATGAVAADLPSRMPPPVYTAPVQAFSWTGFYAGVNAGYAFDGDQANSLSANDFVSALQSAPAYVRNQSYGFTGGGQIGYNYEIGRGLPLAGFVLGLEADAVYTDLNTTSDTITGSGEDTNTHLRTDFVGTVRGRLGYAFDRFLVYGTGGFAYGDVHSATIINGPSGGPGIQFLGSQDTLRTGYAFGGGVEFALPTTSFVNVFHSSAITLKAEALHYDFGTSSYLVQTAPGAALPSSFTNQVHTQGTLVRVGLNFKFDAYAPAAPVVAKY
jgi:outer membrane immunogenic protein